MDHYTGNIANDVEFWALPAVGTWGLGRMHCYELSDHNKMCREYKL